MIDYMHDMMCELADDLRSIYKSYPSKSVEYTIMMQDLSKNPAQSKPLLPGNTKLRGADLRELYNALSIARKEYQELYLILYVRKWGRERKIKALGLTNKNQLYLRRDELQSYILGLMDKKRI